MENRQVELLSNIVELLKKGQEQTRRSGGSIGSFSADDLSKVTSVLKQASDSVKEAKEEIKDIPNVVRDASQQMKDYGKALGAVKVASQQIDKFSGGILGKLFDATGLKKITGSIFNIAKGFRDWGKALKDASGAGQKLFVTLDGITSLVGGLFKTVGSIVGSAIKGVVSIGTGITKFIVGSLSSVLTATTKISKFLVTLPVGIANRAADLGNKLRQELVEVIGQASENTKEYFDLLSNGGKSMIQLRGIAEGALVSFQSVNSTMTKLFGFGAQGASAMISEISQGINNMGIYADVFADSTTKSATSIEFFTRMTRGMGMAADDIAYVMRDAIKNGEHYYVTMTRMKEASDAASYEFGVNRKILSKNFFQLRKDITNFGHLSEIELMKVAARATQMGVEMKDLAGIFNKFGTFEDAANSAALLSQTFGMNIDALQLIRAEDPMEIVEMFRQSMLATGRSFDDLNRHEKSLMASHTGMSVEVLKTTMNYRTLGKSFEEIKKIMNDQKPEERQIRAMKDMSSSMKEQLKIMQKKDFFSAFLDGLTNTIMYAGKLGKTMRKVSKNMQSFYEEGLSIKKKDLDEILGPFDEILNTINNAFSKKSLRKLKNTVVKNIKDFVRDISNPNYVVDWNLVQMRWDEKLSGLFDLSKLLDDQGFLGQLTRASGKIVGYVLNAFALAGPGIIKGLGNAFESAVDWLTTGKISDKVNSKTFAKFLGMSDKDVEHLILRLKASFSSIREYLFGTEEKMAFNKSIGSMLDENLTAFPARIQKSTRKKGLFERLGEKFKEVFKIKEGDGIFSSLFDSLTKKIKELSENKQIRSSLENIGEHIMKGMSKASEAIGKMVDAIMTSAKDWLEKNGYITPKTVTIPKEVSKKENLPTGTSLATGKQDAFAVRAAREGIKGNFGAGLSNQQAENPYAIDSFVNFNNQTFTDATWKANTRILSGMVKAGTKFIPLVNVAVEGLTGNANYQGAVNLVNHFISQGAITQEQGEKILNKAASDQLKNSAAAATGATAGGWIGAPLGAGWLSAFTAAAGAWVGDVLLSEGASMFGYSKANESAWESLKTKVDDGQFTNITEQMKKSKKANKITEQLDTPVPENDVSGEWKIPEIFSFFALQNKNASSEDYRKTYETKHKAYMKNESLKALAEYGGDESRLDYDDVKILVERVKAGEKDALDILKELKDNILNMKNGEPQIVVTVDGYALTSHISMIQQQQNKNAALQTGTRDAGQGLDRSLGNIP